MNIFLSGSMKNPNIPLVGNVLREAGHQVFDDWWSPGPDADDHWQEYERIRRRPYKEALKGPHPQSCYQTDYWHLTQWADVIVLVMPAGKSAHMELGFARGRGMPGYILLPGAPERFEIMHNFATNVFESVDDLLKELGR